ncbi:MAG TPA: LTA synthase family protein [Verrucomicrobiae bacterium]
MNPNPALDARKKSRSRYGFIVFCFASLVLAATILRAGLFFKYAPKNTTPWDGLLAFADGFHRDLIAALWFVLPLLFWCLITGNRLFASLFHRVWFRLCLTVLWSAQVFLLAAEVFFFDEFKSRFNTVAVDYLSAPKEVAGNIWASYPVVPIVAACVLTGAAWMWLAGRIFKTMWTRPIKLGVRFLWFIGGLGAAILLSETATLNGAHISTDRTLNEIANNGGISFYSAFWTRNLDYAAFYKTIPRDEAYARVHRLLDATNATFPGDKYSITRNIAGDPAKPKYNVVILLEESLGSEFWGSLGRQNTLTPAMDGLATHEGILFANLYASGNRTVRGFEGVLSSFPPLPGDSIVKRDRSQNVETIARVLKRDGYNSVFLYGGRGIFDSMKPFALNNGYDRFVEQKDFAKPTFKTIWGVCDEDLYKKAIEEFRELSKQGKPFLGTLLSVSNHKPYTYPKGRIPEDPNGRRENVVKYTDWCLGQFFEAAKKESFWTNTIFVVVADHGARVYGSQDIPIFSYEIPLVILGPAVVKEPLRIHALGGSLDVSPTILGLLGRPYESMFFGRDLLHDSADNAQAVLNHNRDIGMFAHDRMVVLGLQKAVEFYEGDPKVAEIKPKMQPSLEDLELEKDTEAMYQVADELYMNRRYHLDP